MKIIFLVAMLALVSCGEMQEDPGLGQGGEKIPLTPRFLKGTEEGDLIGQVCDALLSKEAVLNEMRQSRIQFPMTYQWSPCEGNVQEMAKTYFIGQASVGEYSFVESNGMLAPLPAVETSSAGEMKEICRNRNDLVSPVYSGGRQAYSFAVLPSIRGCVTDSNHVCIHISKGLIQDDRESFLATELHWIRFRVTGNQQGFYTQRIKRMITPQCPKGEEQLLKLR